MSGLLNKNDKTIGDFLASFLAWPSKLNGKYFVNSQCDQSKYGTGINTIDTLDCSFTVTEEIALMKTESVHIIATMRFSIQQKGEAVADKNIR